MYAFQSRQGLKTNKLARLSFWKGHLIFFLIFSLMLRLRLKNENLCFFYRKKIGRYLVRQTLDIKSWFQCNLCLYDRIIKSYKSTGRLHPISAWRKIIILVISKLISAYFLIVLKCVDGDTVAQKRMTPINYTPVILSF